MKEKKNIAFFLYGFPIISETFILNQIIALKNDGHHVDIYATFKSKDNIVHQKLLDYQLMENVVFLDSLPNRRIGKLKLFFKKIFSDINFRDLFLFFSYINYLILNKKRYVSFYSVIHFLGKPNYDILHAHYGVTGNLVANLKSIGLFRKSKLVTTFHGFDFRVDHPDYYNNLFKVCSIFTVNSQYSKLKLVELGCNQDKIELLPVGINSYEFQIPNNSTEVRDINFTIIFIGRLYEIKAPDLFIEICNQLNQKKYFPFRAILIGDGEQKASLEKKIADNALEQCVKMTGPQTQDEIIRYLSKADIFIMTGKEVDGLAETQGLVIQEAQAMGIPVIISDLGGMKEGIIPNETGFIVEAGNIDMFIEKIKLLHDNPELRKKMGEAGRNFVKSNYDSAILNQKLLNIYNRT